MIILNEKCSAVIMQDIPIKMRDPDSLTIPCEFGNSKKTNLMPFLVYKKLNFIDLKPTRMDIHMTNCSITYPQGIVEDLLVKSRKFFFPIDFVVLDMKEDGDVPIIIGTPFLSNAQELVDIHDSKLTLRVVSEEITFTVDKKNPSTLNRTMMCFSLMEWMRRCMKMMK